MSGSILMFSEVPEDLESSKWNPLQCSICTEQYLDPCILQCYHSFCARCVEGKIEDGKVSCPVCGAVTAIKEDCTLPPPDPLLKFLVESSSTGDKIKCANCDQTDKQMFFCNTCTQPLCVTCREDTHRAKMFLTHEVMMLTKHSRDIQKQCKIHGEPFILFSTEKKLMLCINCFRDMKVESRSHCVDLETAYKQGCQKLDDTMQSIRDLQNSVRDGILLLRCLLEEIEANAQQEKKDIVKLYDTMQEKILETKDSLLKEIDRQYDEKLELFKNQLISLTTFLPTLHVHLVTCAAFSSSATKYEFLDFTYVLMKRLTAIIQVQHPLHPSQTSDIVTEYKAMFARCLEPLLFPHRNNGTSMSVQTSIASNIACTRYDMSPSVNTTATSRPGTSLSPTQPGITRYNHNKTKFKLKLMETKGFFSDHCKEFDDAHRELMQKVEGLKLSMQEVQRDLTLRRSLTKDAAISDLKAKIRLTEELLDKHQDNVGAKQEGLEKHWEEALERIAGEQEVYKAQLQDVGRLKSEIGSVKTILDKLSSFILSIANVTQRLAPKLSNATNVADQDNQHAALLHEISTVQPDSQQRVDAIKTAQEEREIKTANRTNPLDKELIKTKGLLRAPSARKDSAKRSSAEIREALEAIEEYNAELDRAKLDKKGLESVNIKGNANLIKLNETDSEAAMDVFSDSKEIKENGDSREVKGGTNVDAESAQSVPKYTDNLTSGTKDIKGDNTDANAAHVEEPDEAVVKEDSNSDLNAERNLGSLSGAMPDIALQAGSFDGKRITRHCSFNEEQDSLVAENGEISEESSMDLVSASDSELDSSLDITTSSDDSFKPGLVRDIVSKVDGLSKGADDNKSPVTNKTATVSLDGQDEQNGACGLVNGGTIDDEFACVKGNMCTNRPVRSVCKEDKQLNRGNVNGAEYDRVGQFVSGDQDDNAILKQLKTVDNSPVKGDNLPEKCENSPNKCEKSSINSENSPQKREHLAEKCEKTLKSEISLLKCENSPVNCEHGLENPDDEVYVTKSLPELAQVFEPGELKQKKRRGKGDKGDKGKAAKEK